MPLSISYPPQILLNYLPFDQKSWPGYLEKQRSMYRDWVKELVVDPHAKRVRALMRPRSPCIWHSILVIDLR